MRKIINGKIYDTDTATFVASWTNGYQDRDFLYVKKDLYRKKTGEYFLCIEGGPNTSYGVWHGNTCGWGYHIEPITYDCAMEFGMPVEVKNCKIKGMRLKTNLSQQALADKAGISANTIRSWEQGVNIPRDVYTLQKVAKALGCLIEDLI